MILVIILYALFASTFTLGNMAVEIAPPLFFIACRMLIGGSILLGYIFYYKKNAWFLKKSDLKLFAQLILIHIFISFALEFWALQYVSGAKASLIYNLAPFITALYTYILFNERLSRQKVIGLTIGFVGMLPVFIMPALQEGNTFFSISLPEIALLGAVAASSYGWILLKSAMNRGYSLIFANGVAMVGGGALALLSSFLIEGQPMLRLPTSNNDIIAKYIISFSYSFAPLLLFVIYLILLVLIANIICYNLYGYLLKKYSATFLSFVGFICPLFTGLFDWILLGKVITWHFIASFIITSLGIYIFYRHEIEDIIT